MLQPDVLEFEARASPATAGIGPQLHERERYSAASKTHVNYVGILHQEVAAFEVLLRPTGTNNVGDAGRKHTLLNRDVRHRIALHRERRGPITIPARLHREDVVCRPK